MTTWSFIILYDTAEADQFYGMSFSCFERDSQKEEYFYTRIEKFKLQKVDYLSHNILLYECLREIFQVARWASLEKYGGEAKIL